MQLLLAALASAQPSSGMGCVQKFDVVCADLLGFFGAFGFAPMTFWMPSVIWLVVMKPSKKSWDFWLNVLNIVVFVIIMFLAAIGSIYSIIQDAKTYKFYQ